MDLKVNNFLIQIKYADLLRDLSQTGKIDINKYLFGFGGELYLDKKEIGHYKTEVIQAIRHFFTTRGLPLRLHAPITEVDYSCSGNTLRDIEETYRHTIKFCEMLGIKHVVAHAELVYKDRTDVNLHLDHAISLWSAISQRFMDTNIFLTLENHFETSPEGLIGIMDAVDSAYLKMCVDVGHCNAFSGLGIKKYLAMYPPGSISEVHLADNNADSDAHLPLGEGNIDFPAIFTELKKRDEYPVFILEPRTQEETEKSLLFLKNIGVLISANEI